MFTVDRITRRKDSTYTGKPPDEPAVLGVEQPGETQREWGRTIAMESEVTARMNALAESMGL